ncbi:hypothetical protein PshuTeo1_25120 [Pseudomonas hunanensis]|nr:hypothetical protein PshuTeo1_25120 [Pseudomonas hunanensis]
MTVSAVGNFCITVTNETVTPTGGITCSALGGAVDRHLLRLRLTSARSSRRLSTRGSTMANVQISQGNSRDLPAYACRIYVTALCASIGLWRFVPPHPAVPPLSASCSSGQHFASGFLQIRGHPRHPCLRLTLPLAGCVEDFHLQVTRLATTAKRVALTRNAPCLAHTKKRGLGRVEWNITYSVKGGMTTAFHSRRHRSVSLAAQVEMLNIFPRGQLGSTALTHHPAVL